MNLQILIPIVLLILWLTGEGIRQIRRMWARDALVRRNICPDHLKPFTISRQDPEHGCWFTRLCEDCIPAYDAAEKKRMEYLLKKAR